ncbi:MAG: hypothetical protein K8R25_04790 [Methanosarcinales archaeon]|nr:hypothetical protein [Methanosarcinales archaeon]
MKENNDLLFEVITFLGFNVSTTKKYWEIITTVKHPHIIGRESEVISTLRNPDLIRQSRTDENVYLFYREIEYNNKNYHMCTVTNKDKGILITAYITDKIKEGVQIWKKSK